MLNSNQHSISKTELATLIRKYWLVVMTVFLTGTIAMWGFIGIYFTEMYETQVRLLVKLGPQNAETPDTVQRGQLMVQGVRVADINSEVEILSSRSLVETAVDRIGPEAFRPVDPVPESFVGEAKIPVGGEIARTPSGQNGSYRPGKPLLDQRVNSSLRFRSV